MRTIDDYSDDDISAATGAGPFSIVQTAERLGVSPEELGRRLAAQTLHMKVRYAYDKETLEALTCPHCGKVGPPVFIDDPRDYLLPAYGGVMDSKSIVGLMLEGECGACQGSIRLVYTLLEMRTGEPSPERAEAIARAAEAMEGLDPDNPV